jgi:Flp pilus assembly protein TadB
LREDNERREEKKPRGSKSEDERRVRRVQSEGRREPLPKRRRSAQSATRRDRDRERRAGGEGAKKESSTSWIWIVLILIAIAVAIWYFLLREPAEAGVVLLTLVSGSLRPPTIESMSSARSLSDSNQRGGVQHGDS